MSEWWARIRAAWENLSARERLLLGLLGSALAVVLVWAAVLRPIRHAAESASERADDLERQIELMVRLRRDYDEIAARLGAVESRIAASDERGGLRTLLSTLATRSNVKIDSMEERKAPENDRYRETKLEVSLRNVSLGQTINYLHNIEAEERLLSVKSLRIKHARTGVGAGDENLLDVTFTVSAFEPI